MELFAKLGRKKRKLIVGLMSGTSVDGIDAVLLRVEGSGMSTRFQQLAFITHPYPRGLRSLILRNSHTGTARLDEVARLNFLIGELFADAALRVVRNAGRKISDVDVIGSHGQTIHHLPERKRMFGRAIAATLQIGEPAIIAKRTGVVTVGNFRAADVAVGGSGAPLVPYVDYLLFRSPRHNRVLLNIGGIANVTVLPRSCAAEDVTAFDVGPGNMLIDGLMERLYSRSFDRNGEIASSGKLLPSLLKWMLKHPYLCQKPPKSTGREEFGEAFCKALLRRVRRARKQDVITTATEFTALTVFDAARRFIHPRMRIDELIVSGGGVKNAYLMDALTRYFASSKVSAVETLGMSSDAKEAICFALLANETVAGHAANLPGATGARHPTMLGAVSLP